MSASVGQRPRRPDQVLRVRLEMTRRAPSPHPHAQNPARFTTGWERRTVCSDRQVGPGKNKTALVLTLPTGLGHPTLPRFGTTPC